jgi:hypothetical protein
LPGARSGENYILDDVSFDSFDPDLGLLEAKGDYGFTFDSNGGMQSWAQGAFDDLVDQAGRQTRVAGDTPVTWEVGTPELAERLREAFDDLGMDIIVVDRP